MTNILIKDKKQEDRASEEPIDNKLKLIPNEKTSKKINNKTLVPNGYRVVSENKNNNELRDLNEIMVIEKDIPITNGHINKKNNNEYIKYPVTNRGNVKSIPTTSGMKNLPALNKIESQVEERKNENNDNNDTITKDNIITIPARSETVLDLPYNSQNEVMSVQQEVVPGV